MYTVTYLCVPSNAFTLLQLSQQFGTVDGLQTNITKDSSYTTLNHHKTLHK